MEATVGSFCDYKNDELLLQSMLHLDVLLQEESLPPFPRLHHKLSDLVSLEEIRRTLVVVNIDESMGHSFLCATDGFPRNIWEKSYSSGEGAQSCALETNPDPPVSSSTLPMGLPWVYHSTEVIEKPSYLKDPESFKQYLCRLKSHVEDSYKVIERAAKDVSEYEDYCGDNQPTSKSPLKSTETAICEIEEALSKVLSAQSLISVAISPVESQLLSILGETFGGKESIPSSPESFLKYISQKPVYVDEEEDTTKRSKRESSKSKRRETEHAHKRKISRSKERTGKHHSGSGGIGRTYHHDDRPRSQGHASHRSVHLSSVSSNQSNSRSEVHKSTEKQHINEDINDVMNGAEGDKKEIAVKTTQKLSENESKHKINEQGSEEDVLKSVLHSTKTSSERTEVLCDKDMEEGSAKKIRHEMASRGWHSHNDQKSRSRSSSGRRRSLSWRERCRSPALITMSPSSSEKERQRRSHRRRSRSPSLEHHHRHHHHCDVRSRSRRSGSGDRYSRRSSHHGERWKRPKSREGGGSSRSVTKECRNSPKRRGRSSHCRGKDGHEKGTREKKGHHSAVVMVYPESYEDFLDELGGEESREEERGSSQAEDINNADTASGSGSQNSTRGGECEDKEAVNAAISTHFDFKEDNFVPGTDPLFLGVETCSQEDMEN
ncbi:splicing regulatory glutamine/lysine-rich protein 1-like [Hetaerina americana]|uniref:splicing regulatory glutamine/lysine-rich protein 1-like n=1 Tax=Hetaerina americana TaxID=62018 RepID=UPI003A7F3C4F